EAPLLPEVFEGYRVMSALAEDQQILELDKGKGITYVDHKRACRPFGYNCGFTMSESAQFMILFDEELTLERGAEIMGSVPAVFVHADGIKKSITSPGVGNFITMARAASVLDKILGEKGLQERSFVHAHGTGTPQNRVTESQVINMTAENFKINKWPVGAIKCYLGHPIGTAGGDQIMAALGTWRYGVIPGIFTLDEIADDVVSDRLLLSQNHLEYSKEHFEASLVNTKGFGGNNATGVILSPEKTKELIRHKAGEKSFSTYQKKNEKIKKTAEEKEQEKMRGEYNLIYRFGEKVIEGEDLRFEENRIHVKGFKNPVDLD
ncbi:MAG: beta-ketoacyl synthase, partial [Deltaproteobacteria bacterium]|nr:beta-ketoacyl synthase [Deltaproteobacteria bacterium]